MAKNDYYVVIYRVLAYLYACLKAGENANLDYLKYDTSAFPINENYWQYILMHLFDDGLIEGVVIVPVIGEQLKLVKLTPITTITPKGIEYIEENSVMQKTKAFLKEIKEIVPGL